MNGAEDLERGSGVLPAGSILMFPALCAFSRIFEQSSMWIQLWPGFLHNQGPQLLWIQNPHPHFPLMQSHSPCSVIYLFLKNYTWLRTGLYLRPGLFRIFSRSLWLKLETPIDFTKPASLHNSMACRRWWKYINKAGCINYAAEISVQFWFVGLSCCCYTTVMIHTSQVWHKSTSSKTSFPLSSFGSGSAPGFKIIKIKIYST